MLAMRSSLAGWVIACCGWVGSSTTSAGIDGVGSAPCSRSASMPQR
jgi:hypothetical protein